MGAVKNIDVNRRIRQFVFLVFVTVLGMIASSAFYSKGFRSKATESTGQTVTASFK